MSFVAPLGKTASKLKPATIFFKGTGELFAKYSDPINPDSSKVVAKNNIDLSVLIVENLLANSKIKVAESGFDIIPNKNFYPFISFVNGHQILKNQLLKIRIINSRNF